MTPDEELSAEPVAGDASEDEQASDMNLAIRDQPFGGSVVALTSRNCSRCTRARVVTSVRPVRTNTRVE